MAIRIPSEYGSSQEKISRFPFFNFFRQQPPTPKPAGLNSEAPTTALNTNGAIKIFGCVLASKSGNSTPTKMTSRASESDDITQANKKMKRMLANRKSAQKCRILKQEKIERLKAEIQKTQVETSIMSAHIYFEKAKSRAIREENEALRRHIELLVARNAIKAAEYENLKRERDRLSSLMKPKREIKFI